MPLTPQTPRRRHSLPAFHGQRQRQQQDGIHFDSATILSNGNSRKRRRHSSFVESPISFPAPPSRAYLDQTQIEQLHRLAPSTTFLPLTFLHQQRLLYSQQQAFQQQLLEQHFYNPVESSFPSFMMKTECRVENRNDLATFESSNLPRLFTPTQQRQQNHLPTELGLKQTASNLVTPVLPSSISPGPFVPKATTRRDTVKTQLHSIQKAIRRRLHSMTRGTTLVPRRLPSIVIESGTRTGSDIVTDTQQQLQKEWMMPGSIVSINIPNNISCIWKGNGAKEIPKQSLHQVYLRIHSILGEGAFARVVTVTLADHHTEGGCATSGNEEKSCYYACKYIKDEMYEKATAIQSDSSNTNNEKKHRRAYIQAQSQLAYEAHLLGSLHHPNIIQSMGFFPIQDRSVLLTERLDETLAQKLSRWKNTTEIDHRSLEDQKFSICHQLAACLEYVHSHNIAYRDLKPENVGFVGSTLKLFDFGLAREMVSLACEGKNSSSSVTKKAFQTETAGILSSHSSHSTSSQSNSSLCSSPSPTQTKRLLRGRIGTMRYMAPEVCLEEAYDGDCDIYSYSVLCWEIWTHKTPYSILTPASYRELVCLQDFRPPQVEAEIAKLQQQQQDEKQSWDGDMEAVFVQNISTCPLPKPIETLLAKGWVRDPKSRIRWQEIRQELTQIQREYKNLP